MTAKVLYAHAQQYHGDAATEQSSFRARNEVLQPLRSYHTMSHFYGEHLNTDQAVSRSYRCIPQHNSTTTMNYHKLLFVFLTNIMHLFLDLLTLTE